MPIFNYNCNNCGHSERKLTKKDSSVDCEKCGTKMERKLPVELSSETLEMRDRYRGIQLPKNQEAKIKKRMRLNEEKYERAEKIDRQGIETAERLGWTKKKK